MARVPMFSLLVLGILLGLFPWNGLAENTKHHAQYTPYKAGFDLLRASEQSRELDMPLVITNDIERDSDGFPNDDFYLARDSTLRSKRRRRQVPVHNSNSQRFSLCLPYFNTNPLCRQLFLGLGNDNVHAASSQMGIPSPISAYLMPSSNPASAPAFPVANQNEIALNYYYQQQQQIPQQRQTQLVPQLQAVPLQMGVFQGPLPVQRQRQNSQYENIHVKYPYPYPPAPAAVVPESVVTESPVNASTPDATIVPSEIVAATTLAPSQESGSGQPGLVPDSPQAEEASAAPQPSEPEASGVEAETTTASAPSTSSSTAPPSTTVLPPNPEQMNDPAQPQQTHPPRLPSATDIAMQNMQKRIREKEEENRRLSVQLEQANEQIVSYEQENSQLKRSYLRSEEANVKLRDRVLQLENTNQHLQEQNGQLQQVTAEQRTQVSTLKMKAKDAKEQLESFQKQYTPLSQEVQQHRKEIEDFLIRIRKQGEENDKCQEQVKLYQLKVNYILTQQQLNDQAGGEADPELSRMDAEIAALQSSSQNIPNPNPLKDSTLAPIEITTQAPSVTTILPEVETVPGNQQPPQPVKIDIRRDQASRNAAVWEEPAGF